MNMVLDAFIINKNKRKEKSAMAKEKTIKKKSAVKEFRALRRATKATRLGWAPPFEKGGRKLFTEKFFYLFWYCASVGSWFTVFC